jgi:hypothetical protein
MVFELAGSAFMRFDGASGQSHVMSDSGTHRRSPIGLDFASPVAFDLIAWEQIHSHDLRASPNLKRLFAYMTAAARASAISNATRDPVVPQGRRSFHEVGEAELACFLLPRLELILHCWGIEITDEFGPTFSERPLDDGAAERLTGYGSCD